ncbi:unnamed protein product [Ixodes persulcatus]
MDEEDVVRQFRFTKEDLPYLRSALRILETLTTNGWVRVSGDEALAIGLRRLAYPNRLCDLELMFGRHSWTLSIVSNQVHRHIAHTFGHLLRDLTAHSWLDPDQLDVFAEAVHNQGAPLTNCWGFIDGTARAMCRPTWHQRKFFSGHKRYHCTKYQAVMCPNGIIARLDGPYEGCRHDAGILRESGLYTDLEVLMSPKPFVLYGDPAYPHRELLQRNFGGASLTVGQATFNYQMSRVRQSVEWGFGKVATEFAFLDFKKNQKLFLQQLPIMYKVGVILTNCHTCLYESQTSMFFSVAPPTLEEYLTV